MIVRLERDVMIGGALGHVEVRRSLEVGLMAETIVDGALVFFFWFISSLKVVNLKVLLFLLKKKIH